MLRTLPYAETWRWRVLLPPRGERFIISDRGLCEFGDLDLRTGKDWPSHGVFFPLGPALGVLGFLHEPTLHRRVLRPLDFSERLTLNRGYTSLLNLRLWEDAERFVVAHPSDRALIENIDNGAEIGLDPTGRIASGGSASSETDRRGLVPGGGTRLRAAAALRHGSLGRRQYAAVYRRLACSCAMLFSMQAFRAEDRRPRRVHRPTPGNAP